MEVECDTLVLRTIMTERVPREPVRASEAPQPRGILKNAGRRGSSSRHLQWDEHNLQENEDERESQTFMTVSYTHLTLPTID